MLLATGMRAQVVVNAAYFEARGSYNAHFTKPYSGAFSGEVLNFVLEGELTPKLSYQFRQLLNVLPYSANNVLNGTEILSLTWTPTPKWSFQVGKIPVNIGGFEWSFDPIDIYYWTDFCDHIPYISALGAGATFSPNENQSFIVQGTRSLLTDGRYDVFNLSLGWSGQFASWWKTIWGFNLMDDDFHHMMGYLILGNRFEAGPVAFELDGMYRRSFKQRSAGLDMSVTGRLEYTIGKWVLTAKGGYDANSEKNIDPDGYAYDLTVEPGTSYLFGGAGVEYYPLGNKNVRIHTMGWYENRDRAFHLMAGLTFRLHLKRPKQ